VSQGSLSKEAEQPVTELLEYTGPVRRRSTSDVNSHLHNFCTHALLMEDFDTIRRLHSSNHTILELAKQRSTGKERIVKIFNKGLASKSMRRSLSRLSCEDPVQKITREVTMLSQLHHTNVVRLLQLVDNEEDQMLYVVMEYIPGGPSMQWNSLASKYDATAADFRECCALDMLTACSYFCDAAAGLEHIHSHHIIHRDLKPENLLATVPYQPGGKGLLIGRVKVADFGVSCFTDSSGDTICDTQGTLPFEAPESLTGQPYSGISSDIWALGVTLYAFAFQNLPFHNSSPEILNTLIREGKFEIPDDPEVGPDLIELLQQLLEVKPEHRIQMPDILAHSFVSQKTWVEDEGGARLRNAS